MDSNFLGSNGSLPLSIIAARVRDASPRGAVSHEGSPGDSYLALYRSFELPPKSFNDTRNPPSVESTSLNEFLRLEELETAEDLDRLLLEGQEGDTSLVDSVVGMMGEVDEEDDLTPTSISRIGGGGLITDSISMLSTSDMTTTSFVSLPHPAVPTSRSDLGSCRLHSPGAHSLARTGTHHLILFNSLVGGLLHAGHFNVCVV